MRYVLSAVVAVLLAAVAAADDRSSEVLLGFGADAEKGQLTFEVWTGGCTAKQDFRLERSGTTLTLIRVRRDTCKALVSRTQVTFTLEEAGLKPSHTFTLANRFVSSEFAAGIE